MAANVEIKAKVDDLQKLKSIAERLGGGPERILEQEDTFFHVPNGRLKLRALGPTHGELIYYEREDVAGPKPCNYLIARTADPAALKATLTAALGVRGVVRKIRHLHLVGQTRVHLDEVEGLGNFLELEVVLQPGQSPEEGRRIAEGLMRQLGIDESQLIRGAYIDLLVPAP